MVGKAADHHVRHRRLGGNATFDQSRRRRLLHHNARATAAGKFGSARDQHAVLRRDYVEPLGTVLADLHHLCLAAGTRRVQRRQHRLDAWQMGRQCPTAGTPFLSPFAPQPRIVLLGFRFDLGDRCFEVLQTQRQLFCGQPLRFPSELHPAQLQQQGVQPLIAHRQRVALSNRRITLRGGGIARCNSRVAFRYDRQNQGPQCLGVGRQFIGCTRNDARHADNSMPPRSAWESVSLPARASNRGHRIVLRTPAPTAS